MDKRLTVKTNLTGAQRQRNLTGYKSQYGNRYKFKQAVDAINDIMLSVSESRPEECFDVVDSFLDAIIKVFTDRKTRFESDKEAEDEAFIERLERVKQMQPSENTLDRDFNNYYREVARNSTKKPVKTSRFKF